MVAPSEQNASDPAVDERPTHELTIPLPGFKGTVAVAYPSPLTSDEWEYVIDVLTVMAPGFVTDAPRAYVNPDGF